jgi:hypothetical protein
MIFFYLLEKFYVFFCVERRKPGLEIRKSTTARGLHARTLLWQHCLPPATKEVRIEIRYARLAAQDADSSTDLASIKVSKSPLLNLLNSL